ncbi:MAG: class I SAM-dependent methyltransferase, partial [Alphaproteobacteria bacterium]|nr:class I SAM-dependent methyltransferase [Alphaproteobacteria bacterium]
NDHGTGEPVCGLHYHVEAAETFFRARAGQFGAIVSRAVLEHLYDPLAALDDMAQALAPGGILIHRIDFRDHGMFTGHHPLTFLTLPGALYGAMSRNSGRPNRVLIPGYRDWLLRSGLKGSLRATRLVGVEGEIGPAEWAAIDPALQRQALASVATIRPRLALPFRNFSDQDLAVAGVVLVAERPL